jgi:hypothetical protein
MFYRTNLTLSASFNRLNLGTRSFALNANVNHGGNASRANRTHHDSMRERMSWYMDTPIIISEESVPSSSGSRSKVVPVSPGCPSGKPGGPAVPGGVVSVSRFIGLDLASAQLLTQPCQRLSQALPAGQSRTEWVSLRKPLRAKTSKPARATTAYGAAWRATESKAATLAAFAAK